MTLCFILKQNSRTFSQSWFQNFVSLFRLRGIAPLTSIEACLFKHPFYCRSLSKGTKQRAQHVHKKQNTSSKSLYASIHLFNTCGTPTIWVPMERLWKVWLKPAKTQNFIFKSCPKNSVISVSRFFRYLVNKNLRRRPFFRNSSEFRYLGFRYSGRYLYLSQLFLSASWDLCA